MDPELLKKLLAEYEPQIAARVLAEVEKKAPRGDLAAALAAASGSQRAKQLERSPEERRKALGAWIHLAAAPFEMSKRADPKQSFERYKLFEGGEFTADREKALLESVYAQGGSLVPITQSSEVIEYLRAEPVLTQLGARVMEFDSELEIGRLNGGTTGYWSGEAKSATGSTLGTGKVVLKAHKLIVLCDVSNDMIRKGRGEEITGQDMVTEAGFRFDLAGIQGSGQQDQPMGVLNQVDANNVFASAAGSSNTAAQWISDLDKAVQLVKQTNIPFAKTGFLITPRIEKLLKGLTNGTNGTWTFRDEMRSGMLAGYPYKVSTNMDDTKVIFGVWSELIYGVETRMALTVHPDQLADQDLTRTRLVMRGDFQLRHPKSFAVITGF